MPPAHSNQAIMIGIPTGATPKIATRPKGITTTPVAMNKSHTAKRGIIAQFARLTNLPRKVRLVILSLNLAIGIGVGYHRLLARATIFVWFGITRAAVNRILSVANGDLRILRAKAHSHNGVPRAVARRERWPFVARRLVLTLKALFTSSLTRIKPTSRKPVVRSPFRLEAGRNIVRRRTRCLTNREISYYPGPVNSRQAALA